MNLISKVLPSIPQKVFGEVWTARDSIRRWEKVAMSGSGQHQLALTSTIGSDLKQLYVSSDYGSTWTAKESPKTWSDIKLSFNGEIQVVLQSDENVGRIYVSRDFGNTWQAKGPDLDGTATFWQHTAISVDGAYIIAIAAGVGFTISRVFSSFDFGETWTESSNIPWHTYGYGALKGISISTSGQHQVIQATNNTIISSDYGATWSTSKLFRRDASQPVISSNGQIQMLFGKETQFQDYPQINASTDFGNTWVKKEYLTTRDWRKLVISADGTRAAGIVGGNEIFVSTNSGNTWTSKFGIAVGNVSDLLFLLQMSSDGKNLITGSFVALYVSTDFGETWGLKFSATQGITDAKISQDGARATAVLTTEKIYTTQRTRLI